jgi:alpha-glucosidase
MPWWENAVIYQIYPRSFADSDGDGVGDLRGVASKLDYLADLGIDGIWLNPITPSPNVDWGYDVSDYCSVDPELGTLQDLDALVWAAGKRGIRVLLDIVPNHTSIEHPWFRERPDFYVWSDEIPNNWRAAFGGGPAWTLDEQTGRYYLHNFAPGQPDLDWWNPEVRSEFERILRFWFDRGVAGFRIDVAHALVKDRELRDDPPATADDAPSVQRTGLKHVHSMNQPEVHDLWRSWRWLADSYEPPRVLLGEAYVLDAVELAKFYGEGDELNMVFGFKLLHAPFRAEPLRAVVEEIEAAFPARAVPAWTGSNHDDLRLATRWAEGDERKAKLALLLLLTLRGTTVLYMGDELALENGEVPPDRVLDCAEPSRDPGRTPFPWSRDGEEWRDPWLPFTPTARNAAESETVAFARELIRLKREVTGSYETLPSPPGTWVYRRGSGHTVVLCFEGSAPVEGEPLIAVGEPGEPWSGALYASQ